jgi:hypothetical protein
MSIEDLAFAVNGHSSTTTVSYMGYPSFLYLSLSYLRVAGSFSFYMHVGRQFGLGSMKKTGYFEPSEI